MAGEKQAKEDKKTVLPVLARPAAMAAAFDSATPHSIKRLGYLAANLVKQREDFRSALTTQRFLLVLAKRNKVSPNAWRTEDDGWLMEGMVGIKETIKDDHSKFDNSFLARR